MMRMPMLEERREDGKKKLWGPDSACLGFLLGEGCKFKKKEGGPSRTPMGANGGAPPKASTQRESPKPPLKLPLRSGGTPAQPAASLPGGIPMQPSAATKKRGLFFPPGVSEALFFLRQPIRGRLKTPHSFFFSLSLFFQPFLHPSFPPPRATSVTQLANPMGPLPSALERGRGCLRRGVMGKGRERERESREFFSSARAFPCGMRERGLGSVR